MSQNQRSIRFVVVVIFAFLAVTMTARVNAQTLATGDMVFTGYQASGPTTATDQFAFVPLVALPTGTIIKFTDNAWNSTTLAFNTNETIYTYTTTAPVTAGREIVIVLGPPATATFTDGLSAGTVTVAGTNSLPNAGDQLIAYQDPGGIITFITGIHMNQETGCGSPPGNTTAAGWEPEPCVFPTSPSSNTSMKPAAFTTDVNAIWIRPEQDNARFDNCAAPLATAAQVRAAVNNYGASPGNWLVDDNGVALPPWAVGVPGCTTTYGHCGTASRCSFLGFPTAADGSVSGRITDPGGNAVAGAVVRLSGAQNRKTITNEKGYYQFDEVETSGFYTVTPSRANYSFSPSNRSFSQLGNHTDAAFTGSSGGDNLNPLDTAEYFVRQLYVDLLGREPDEGGFNYWSDEILGCGNDAACVQARRSDIAAAFFVEQEFQQTGAFIYGLYQGSLGRRPVFGEYSSDRKQVVGGPNLDAHKAAFTESFVQRAEFLTKYQANTTPESFVDALLEQVWETSKVDLAGDRSLLLAIYQTGSNTNQSRARVLQQVIAEPSFKAVEYNPAFVLTEYFAYLRRNPEPEGYDFWLNVLNHREPGNFRGMVCSFITSTEYQRRFSSVVTHSNAECGR